MSFDSEVSGLSETHAPAAISDAVQLDLARESVSKLGEKIENLKADVAKLGEELAASTISLSKYEITKKELDTALTRARKSLAVYEMQERRLSKIISI